MTIHAYAAKSAKSEVEPFEYETEPLSPINVEVRVQYCGVCHSDLAMIDNDWGISTYPLVPGHEVVGEITAIGDSVRDLKVGQRVGVGWQSGSCQRCRYCHRGKEHLCVNEQQPTIVGRYGGWGESVRSQARFAIPIPDRIDPAIAGPLMCAGTTVWTPMRHYGVVPGMKTAVLGMGGLGHLAVQFLANFGTDVTAISSSHVDWGQFVEALAPEGRLCIVGVPESEVKIPPFPTITYQRSISGGCAGAPSDTAEMLEFCARYDVKPMCEQFEMPDANQAIQHVREGKVRYRAVLAN